ncbi:MAG: hypothetical protein AAGJ87_15690, partial [Pseudomonadota bacterium]
GSSIYHKNLAFRKIEKWDVSFRKRRQVLDLRSMNGRHDRGDYPPSLVQLTVEVSDTALGSSALIGPPLVVKEHGFLYALDHERIGRNGIEAREISSRTTISREPPTSTLSEGLSPGDGTSVVVRSSARNTSRDGVDYSLNARLNKNSTRKDVQDNRAFIKAGDARIIPIDVLDVMNGRDKGGGVVCVFVANENAPMETDSVTLNIRIALKIVDDERIRRDEVREESYQIQRTLSSSEPESVLNVQPSVGGEVRVELRLFAAFVQPDRVLIYGSALLFEGTSESTTDLDGVKIIAVSKLTNETIDERFVVENTDEGGDYCEIHLAGEVS